MQVFFLSGITCTLFKLPSAQTSVCSAQDVIHTLFLFVYLCLFLTYLLFAACLVKLQFLIKLIVCVDSAVKIQIS